MNNLPDFPTTEDQSTTPPPSGRVAFSYPERDLYDIADAAGCEAHIMTSAELAGMAE